MHRAARIDAATGNCVPAAARTSASTRTGDALQFWPSDIDRLFRQAGIGLRRPPPTRPAARFDARPKADRRDPRLAPDTSITYQLRPGRLDIEQLAFATVTDADVQSRCTGSSTGVVAQVERGDTFSGNRK
ncbi:MAG: hypothetical protein U5K38_19845 [Woeseiaceae bacterium]|nr:hypothetical protein [Woeseiaceae bacterium]